MGVVLLVRHGQASFGSEDYDVLSERGREQGRLLGSWLAERGLRPTSLVQGAMRRHRETAEAMVAAAGWTLDVETDPGWDEIDHAAVVAAYSPTPVDGSDPRSFQRVFEQATERWTAGRDDEEYDETWAGFRTRVGAATVRACAAAGPGGTVVVVSSGGPIAAACAPLVDPHADAAAHARIWRRLNTVLVNASMTRLVVGPTGVRMLTFNEHPHLEGESLTYR